MSRDLAREAAILRRRERDSAHPPCPDCGGDWWYAAGRHWHRTKWVPDENAVNGYRPEFCPRSKYGRRQSEAEQDAERAALTEGMDIGEEYEAAIESSWEHRRVVEP